MEDLVRIEVEVLAETARIEVEVTIEIDPEAEVIAEAEALTDMITRDMLINSTKEIRDYTEIELQEVMSQIEVKAEEDSKVETGIEIGANPAKLDMSKGEKYIGSSHQEED